MIGFLGLGHLGLVSAAVAAGKGFDVVAFDEDTELVDRVAVGELPVAEPGLPELLAAHRGQLRFVADAGELSRCKLLYVALDVPTRADDIADTGPVERLLEVADAAGSRGAVVVVLSQVPPGFTRGWRERMERGGRTLYYQVETLVFGCAIERALEPERVVLGCPDPTVRLPEPLASHLETYGCPVLPMRYESAELCKIAINAFLASSISTTNMLAELCERIGADWTEIAPALRLDHRIGQGAYLSPGLGIGGPNLSRDLGTIDRLAWEYGADATLVAAWRSHSAHRLSWPLDVLHERLLGRATDAAIAIWGLAYKENTRSTCNSAGVALATTLAAAGLDVAAYDPAAEPVPIPSPTFSRLSAPLDACAGADALVIATPWPEFREIEARTIAETLRGHLVVDPFGIVDRRSANAANLVVARGGSAVPPC